MPVVVSSGTVADFSGFKVELAFAFSPFSAALIGDVGAGSAGFASFTGPEGEVAGVLLLKALYSLTKKPRGTILSIWVFSNPSELNASSSRSPVKGGVMANVFARIS